MKAVGARLPRYDGIEHVTGRTTYVDDVRVPRMLWAKALRSPLHSASLSGLDVSKAESMPGVHAVITAADVPLLEYGHLSALGIPADEPLLAKDEVRYKGQPIALVAAEDEETAMAAVDAIAVDFEERTPLFDIRKAFDADAPRVHHWGNWYPHFEGEMDRRQIRKGSIDEAFEQADVIVQGVTGLPRSSTCRSRRRSRSSCRGERPSHDLLMHAGALLLDGRRRGPPAGAAQQAEARRRHRRWRLRWQGREGQQDDVRLLAQKSGRPVKWRWTREEEFLCSSTRAP